MPRSWAKSRSKSCQLKVRRLLVCQNDSCCRLFVSWLAKYLLFVFCLFKLPCFSKWYWWCLCCWSMCVTQSTQCVCVASACVCMSAHGIVAVCLCFWSTCVCQHGIVTMCLCCWSTCVCRSPRSRQLDSMSSLVLSAIVSLIIGCTATAHLCTWTLNMCTCVHQHWTCARDVPQL